MGDSMSSITIAGNTSGSITLTVPDIAGTSTLTLPTGTSNIMTQSTLSANVATLTANNTSFVGSVSAANVVSNAQLSANLSNYQTTAGLSANVAILTANNANNLGGVAAASYINTTGSYTKSGVLTLNSNLAVNAAIVTTSGVGTAGQFLTSNGSNKVYWSSGARIVDGVAKYGGGVTQLDWSIPSDVIRITMNFTYMSTDGTSLIVVRLGTSGPTWVTSGYVGTASQSDGTKVAMSSGFLVSSSQAATYVYHGQAVLWRIEPDDWTFTNSLGLSDSTGTRYGAGSVALTGPATDIRLTTVGGVNTFDAPTIVNVHFES